MQLTTEQILNCLEEFVAKDCPSSRNEMLSPNYEVYYYAPYWTLEQAACLISGLKTIDPETFHILISLDSYELNENNNLFDKKEQSLEYQDFKSFLVEKFPIPHKKIHLLKNIYEKLKLASSDGRLNFRTTQINNTQIKIFKPTDIINLVKIENLSSTMPILSSLNVIMCMLGPVNQLELPQTFPNQVNFFFKWKATKNPVVREQSIKEPNKQIASINQLDLKNPNKEIFISYVYNDEIIASKLYEALRLHGVKVWWDQKNIKFGESITDKINEGLLNYRFVALLLSQKFIDNKRYAKKEYKAALQLSLKDPNRKFLPIHIGIGSEEIAKYDASLADISGKKINKSIPIDPQIEDIVKAILEWF